MVSKLAKDESVTEETEVRGPKGLLEKLENYFVDDYPLINRRHDFTKCKQVRGEGFMQWWETKLRKAKECTLKKMTRDDWLMLELVQWVNDTTLQQRLFQKETPTLKKLVAIAKLWQSAESDYRVCTPGKHGREEGTRRRNRGCPEDIELQERHERRMDEPATE